MNIVREYWKKSSAWTKILFIIIVVPSTIAVTRIALDSSYPKLTAKLILLLVLVVCSWPLMFRRSKYDVKVVANATADPAFESEARRQGRVVLHRQRLFVGPMVLWLLLCFVLLVLIFFIPDKARLWILGAFFGFSFASFLVAQPMWYKHFKQRYPHLPTVRCPTCGGTARVERAESPDTHLYLVCPQCSQRADTNFFVSPFSFYS
jgi:hypothetical protein